MTNEEMLLKVDISNAYNTISRAACMEGVKKYCPDVARWAHWCLNGSSRVDYNTHVIPCSTGVQQGDPLGPLPFAAGPHDALEEIAHDELHQIWYLDDGLWPACSPPANFGSTYTLALCKTGSILTLTSAKSTLRPAAPNRYSPTWCQL